MNKDWHAKTKMRIEHPLNYVCVVIVTSALATVSACGGSGDSERATGTPAESEQPSASATPAAITRGEALDILPKMALQLEDLPAGFEQRDSAFDSLDQEANRADDPDRFRRQLESWGFELGHDVYYLREASEGLLDLTVEVWLLADEDGAEEAFVDGRLYLQPADTTIEPFDDFPKLGDDSEAYTVSGPYDTITGETIQAEGYMVIVRVGRFLAVFMSASPSGQAPLDEAVSLAEKLESRMKAEAR